MFDDHVRPINNSDIFGIQPQQHSTDSADIVTKWKAPWGLQAEVTTSFELVQTLILYTHSSELQKSHPYPQHPSSLVQSIVKSSSPGQLHYSCSFEGNLTTPLQILVKSIVNQLNQVNFTMCVFCAFSGSPLPRSRPGSARLCLGQLDALPRLQRLKLRRSLRPSVTSAAWAAVLLLG